MFVLGVIVGKSIIKNMKLPLSLQLDSMSISKFEKWYRKEKEKIFGKFIYNNKKIDYKNTFIKNKYFFISWLIVTLILTSAEISSLHSRFNASSMVSKGS